MLSRQYNINKSKGFTIVELIVVISVIAILAAISIMGYGAWRTNVTVTQVKNDLDAAASAMEDYRTYNNGYPSTLPATVTPSKHVTLTVSSDSSATAYCIDGVSSDSASNTYYVSSGTKDQGALPGTCATNNMLAGWWKLNGNANDESGGNNGTVYGAVPTTGASGASNGAYLFNGTSDYIDMPNASQQSPGTSNFSISTWFSASSVGSLNGSIIYCKENLYEVSAGGGYVTYAWQPNWAWDGGTSFPITVGAWYNATVVYDGANQYLYANGVLVYSRPQTGVIGSNTNRLSLATRGASGGGSSPFGGAIDDVRTYNRALSASDVLAIYNAGAQ